MNFVNIINENVTNFLGMIFSGITLLLLVYDRISSHIWRKKMFSLENTKLKILDESVIGIDESNNLIKGNDYIILEKNDGSKTLCRPTPRAESNSVLFCDRENIIFSGCKTLDEVKKLGKVYKAS